MVGFVSLAKFRLKDADFENKVLQEIALSMLAAAQK